MHVAHRIKLLAGRFHAMFTVIACTQCRTQLHSDRGHVGGLDTLLVQEQRFRLRLALVRAALLRRCRVDAILPFSSSFGSERAL